MSRHTTDCPIVLLHVPSHHRMSRQHCATAYRAAIVFAARCATITIAAHCASAALLHVMQPSYLLPVCSGSAAAGITAMPSLVPARHGTEGIGPATQN